MRDLKSTPHLSNPPTASNLATVLHNLAITTGATADKHRALALVLLPSEFVKLLFASH